MLYVASERLEHVLCLVVDELRRELDRRHLDKLAHRVLFEFFPHALFLARAQLCLDRRAQARDLCVLAYLLGEIVIQSWQLALLHPVQGDVEFGGFAGDVLVSVVVRHRERERFLFTRTKAYQLLGETSRRLGALGVDNVFCLLAIEQRFFGLPDFRA